MGDDTSIIDNVCIWIDSRRSIANGEAQRSVSPSQLANIKFSCICFPFPPGVGGLRRAETEGLRERGQEVRLSSG